MTYKERLYPWAIARLYPNMQRIIVGRFRSRSDADGHLQYLRYLIPTGNFIVIFDHQPDKSHDLNGSQVQDILNQRLECIVLTGNDMTDLEGDR